MSCSPQVPRPEDSDSSDYGSDFTADEEELLNELLVKASAEHAPADAGATPIPSPSLPSNHPVASKNTPTNAVAEPDPNDLESLQPAVLAALVADIEDGIEDPPSVRLPKVLGREKPRSPWRQPGQNSWLGPAASWSARTMGSSQGSNRNSPIGKATPCVLVDHVPRCNTIDPG